MRIPILYQIEYELRKLRNRIKCKEVIKAQNEAFEANFGNSKKMIVYMNFEDNRMSGGIMSIFNFANISKKLRHLHGCDILHANLFNKLDKYYLKQTTFRNDEITYRLKQVMEHAKKLDKLILNVPEMLLVEFTQGLTPRYKKILKNIPDFQINVMNQQIEGFAPPEEWQELWQITDNITQTTGFESYTTQEVCDRYGIPLYHLTHYNGYHKGYEKTELKDKEKLFLYSPDFHPSKERVLSVLKEGLSDFKFQEINGITFDEYMLTLQKAMFCLTFGEGFDGYFMTINFIGGLGLAVYNETFFPSRKFLEFPTVYESYDQLAENIVKDVRHYLENPSEYKEISKKVEAINEKEAYDEQRTYNCLERFYKKEPTFIPNSVKNSKECELL